MAKKRGDKGPDGVELIVCRNPKARERYEIEEKLEAGIVLLGSEVKSMRMRRADLEGAYAMIERDELFLFKMHVAPYEQAGPYLGHDPKRTRKLLVHASEIEKLRGRLTQQGYTLVPLQVYFKNGVAKVELGLARGRKKGDDREALRKELDLKEARAAMERRRG